MSSRIEGGPQAILECALLKIPIVSTDVGIASEILHPNSIYDMNTFHQAQPEINYAHEKAKDFIIPNIMKSFNDLLSRFMKVSIGTNLKDGPWGGEIYLQLIYQIS